MPYARTSPHPRLQAFVASLTSLVNRKADEATTLTEGRKLLGTLVELLDAKATGLGQVGLFLGHPVVALLLSVLFAMWAFGAQGQRCELQAFQPK